MTAFTITTSQNIDALTSKTGGDTYAINGGTLTIDQDSRYGLNQSTSASLGSITISSTQGGTVEIDARAVRLIPYSSGSGNVPAAGTTISQGGTTGILIGVWSAINAAPTAAGSAMPATGFIKVKQVSGAYASGALAGIGASATGADVVGWIELIGDENGNVTVPRLGLFRMRGDWFAVGTTTGTNTDTYQLPTSGSNFYAAGVWVETATAGTYEFYPCAGSLVVSASVATDAVRGKVCWISTAGVLRFGHDGTNSNTGYTPPSGRKIRIPNIITQNCTTAARTANALPNSTLGTRYDFTTTAGGQISIDKALLAWYPSFSQAYSVAMNYTGVLEQVLISTIPTPINWVQVGVGQCAAQANQALSQTNCYQGGTMTECVWSRATLTTSSVVQRQSCSGFTFLREKIFTFTNRNTASAWTAVDSLLENCTYDTPTFIGSEARLTAGLNVNYANITYADNITGTTGTANAVKAVHLTGACNGVTVDGISFGGLTNCHPYDYLVGVDNASGSGAKNVTVQNIGTYASPLDLGSVNPCNGPFNVLGSTAMGGTNKVRRVYTTNTRNSAPFTQAGSDSYGFVLENCFGDYADSVLFRMSGAKVKGYGGTPDMAAQTGYYDQTWIDCFTSTTAGRIVAYMNEPASQMAPYVTLTGGASFAGAGSLYMPTIGMAAQFEMDYYAIGHTGFSNTALVMAGGTAGNYTYQYQIDKNNGAGWSTLSSVLTAAQLGTALAGETGIDASLGIKLRIKITTGTTNTSAITGFYLVTTSSTTAQAYQYPLDTVNLTIQNVVSGSAWRVEDSSDNSLIASGTAIGGDISVSVVYSGSPRTLRVKVRKGTAAPKYLPFETLVVVSASGGTTYVSQIADTIAA